MSARLRLRDSASATRWVKLWDRFWFPETSALRLGVCRILAAGAQLLFFLPSLGIQINLMERSGGFIEPQLIVRLISVLVPADAFFSPEAFTVLYWVTIISGVTTTIGFLTRPSAFLFALGNWVLIAHQYSYGEEHHPEAIICVFLMTLAFSPSGNRLSMDALLRRRRSRPRGGGVQKFDTAFWPLRLAQVLLVISYVSNGVSKLVFGGPQWLNGYTLQYHILSNAVTWQKPLGLWLAHQHGLSLLLSYATIFFETFFFVVLIFPWTIPFVLIGGVLLHIGISVAMWANFYEHIVLYSVFIPWERFIAGEKPPGGQP